MPKWIIVLILTPPALYALHRIALWMEGRGWIYYKTSGSPSTRANAFLSVQQILEADKRHVVEERIRQADYRSDADSGDPPDPDDERP